MDELITKERELRKAWQTLKLLTPKRYSCFLTTHYNREWDIDKQEIEWRAEVVGPGFTLLSSRNQSPLKAVQRCIQILNKARSKNNGLLFVKYLQKRVNVITGAWEGGWGWEVEATDEVELNQNK